MALPRVIEKPGLKVELSEGEEWHQLTPEEELQAELASSPSVQSQILEKLCKLESELVDEGKPIKPIPTQVVVAAFLKSKASSVSERSVKAYRSTLNPFAVYFPILPFAPEEIERYFVRTCKRTGKQVSKRTTNGEHIRLKMLYKFAHDRFGVANIMTMVDPPVFKEVERYAFSLEEAKAVLDEASKNELHLGLYHLWIGHGWRLGEAVRANIGDIGDGDILVRGGKERAEYTVMLSETKALLSRLSNGRKPDEPIFLSGWHRRLSEKQAYNIGKDVMERAGVLKGKPADLRIATHTLRHTFSTLAQEAGMDFAACQRLMRHGSKTQTEHYTHLSARYLRDQLERYSPLRLINGNQPPTTAKLPKIKY